MPEYWAVLGLVPWYPSLPAEFFAMADRNVPSSYPTIRAAITAASTGDTIKIASGVYDIAAGGPPTFAYATGNVFSLSGFDPVTYLFYDGVGNSGDASVTTIVGNARLFVDSTDGKPPTQIQFTDLDFFYGPSSGYPLSSGYLLQTGLPTQATGAITQTIFLDNLSFRGEHQGAGGTNNPFGNYNSIFGFKDFTFSNSSVALTGQSSFNGTNSGGSSFLMLQGGLNGGKLDVLNNSFDESGYRNAFSIFGSDNVKIQGNTFFRSNAATQYTRSGGNKISNSTNVTVGVSAVNGSPAQANTFQNGSYLAIDGGTTGRVAGNTFNGTTMNSASSGAVGIVIEGSPTSFTFTENVFRFVSPFVNNSTTVGVYNVATTTALANTFINPGNGSSNPMQNYLTGNSTNNSILVTSPTRTRDFISGGGGNDTLSGGAYSVPTDNSDIDYFLFNTTPSPTNFDTILNWSFGAGGAFSDQFVLDRKIFTNISPTSSAVGGTGVAGAIGLLSRTDAQVKATATGAPAAGDTAVRLILDNSGAGAGTLWYWVNGSAGPGVAFAQVFTDSAGTTPVTSTTNIGNFMLI
jgi:hypothetical protein